MPVATKGNPLPLERWIARVSIHAALKGQEDKPSPIALSEAQLSRGANVYVNHCAGCHGLPEHPARIAKGMYPHPPQLFEPDEGVTDDPVGETYWKVSNGIRLTGMPAYADVLSDTEMWQVSMLLKNSDNLPKAVRLDLSKAASH